MEKSEKHRFHDKPGLIPVEKAKTKLKSKKVQSPQTQENHINNQNIMIQGEVPVIQNQQLYGVPQQQMMMPPYGQPVMGNNIPGQYFPPNPYVLNQIPPVSETVKPLKFGYIAKEIVCPYCQSNTLTKVEENFNFCTCFCYIFIILLIPILLVLAAYSGCNNTHCNNGCDCDCNCCYCGPCECKCCIDSNHYCANCGKLLGSKDTCMELCPCFSSCTC